MSMNKRFIHWYPSSGILKCFLLLDFFLIFFCNGHFNLLYNKKTAPNHMSSSASNTCTVKYFVTQSGKLKPFVLYFVLKLLHFCNYTVHSWVSRVNVVTLPNNSHPYSKSTVVTNEKKKREERGWRATEELEQGPRDNKEETAESLSQCMPLLSLLTETSTII